VQGICKVGKILNAKDLNLGWLGTKRIELREIYFGMTGLGCKEVD
jgi:hypothetical protein